MSRSPSPNAPTGPDTLKCLRRRGKSAPARRWRPALEPLEDRLAPALVTLFGNGNSVAPSLSADGRFVAFESAATNLITGDTNGFVDIYVKDLQAGTITRASTATGGGQGNADALRPALSADGRFVAFQSAATNLVPNDTNNRVDIFVKDLQTGTLTRASVTAAGVQGNEDAIVASISGNGGFIAFQSAAGNLVTGDTDGFNDIFLKDMQSGAVTRASSTAAGVQGNFHSSDPALSADGRFVAFSSGASNLAPGTINGDPDILIKDLQSGAVTLVSIATAEGNGASFSPAISADGRFVAFQSAATNLVAGDANGFGDIFVKDRQTGTVLRASTDANGGEANERSTDRPAISADGRFVAFQSFATNLVPGDTNNESDVFVKDLQTGALTRVSTAAAGTQGNSRSFHPALRADGRLVAFDSSATNLVPGDGNGAADLFVKDLQTGTVSVASAVVTDVPSDTSAQKSIGVFDPSTGLWYLRNRNGPGAPNLGPFAYGAPGWIPVAGDWDGSGTTTVGVFDPATATWYLRNRNSSGAPDITPFQYGAPGWIPVAGDWDGDGTTSIGVFDPATATWYLKNSNGPGASDVTPFAFGGPGWKPVAGDWDGSGTATVGVFDPAGTWYLRNRNSPGAPDITPFAYGGPGWKPVAGDWDGNDTATVGVLDPAGNWYLRNSNGPGVPNIGPFAYGGPGWIPVSGDWDGLPPGESRVSAGVLDAAFAEMALFEVSEGKGKAPQG